MTTETAGAITASGSEHLAAGLLLDRAQEAIAFERERADRAEAELGALADSLGQALAAGAGQRERADRAEAEVERLRALLAEHEECLLPGEAARRLGTTVRSLRTLEKAGKLKSKRTGGNHRRFPVSGVEALLRAREGARR